MQIITDEIKSNLLQYQKYSNTNVGRLFHGRGGCFTNYEQINIDRFANFAFIISHTEIALDTFKQLAEIILEIVEDVDYVFLQDRRTSVAKFPHVKSRESADMGIFTNNLDELIINQSVQMTEQSLKFSLLKNIKQNFGLFTDTFTLRDYVLKNSKDKKVLNLFSYTCAFSVFAIAGGAQNVVNVDMNKNLLNQGRQNHILNNHDLRTVSFLPYPIMRSLSRIRKYGPYDLIICDPPAAQSSSFSIKKEYQKLFRSAASMLEKDGTLIICYNGPNLSYDDLLDLLDYKSCNTSLSYQGIIEQTFSYKEVNPDHGLKVLVFKRS